MQLAISLPSRSLKLKNLKIIKQEAFSVPRNPMSFSLFLIEPPIGFDCSGDGVWINSCYKVDFHKSPFLLPQVIMRIDPTCKYLFHGLLIRDFF